MSPHRAAPAATRANANAVPRHRSPTLAPSTDMDKEARLAGTTAAEHPEALRLWLRMLTCTQLIINILTTFAKKAS